MSDLDAAVEAAAKAMQTAMLGRLVPHTDKQYERIARAAVEAAAPILRAGALRDAADDRYDFSTWPGGEDVHDDLGTWLRERADRIEEQP